MFFIGLKKQRKILKNLRRLSVELQATIYFKKTFIVEFYAFRGGVSAILMKKIRPPTFESHQLKRKNLLKAICEKEMFDILHGVMK
jgi:hypothetical protein